MVDHADDEGEGRPAGQAPPAKWDPLARGEPAPTEGLGEGERVAKALARAGVASRREVERYIAAGRVALNGKVLETPAVKVAPGDILTVDGAVVGGPEPTRLFRYHKPSGLITTNSDPQGRPTVFEHLPDGLPRVLAVGRLDLNTEGLLLLTNDGALSRALELPSSGWMRRYRARAYGRIDQARLDALAEGVTVDGVAYGPIEARLDKASGHDRESGAANVWISIGITEGKNREVRKVLEHLGLKVNRLIRLAYGPFALGTLEVGQVEEVGPRVIREQLAEHVAPANLPTGDRVVAAPPAPPRPRTEAGSPRRAGQPKDGRSPSVRGPVDRRAPAEGAERRLAEAPFRKPAKPSGKARPFAGGADGPRGGRLASSGAGKPKRPGNARGWIDKPGGRSEGSRDGRAHTDGPREARARSGRSAAAAPGGAHAEAPRGGKPAFRDRPSEDRQRGGKPAFGKPAPGRSTGMGGKPVGSKAGSATGPKSGAASSRTGLELTPPMRRTPRGSGPRRPPRKD